MLIALVTLGIVNLLVSGAIWHAVSHLGLRSVETADIVDRLHQRVTHAIATKATPLHGPTGPVR